MYRIPFLIVFAVLLILLSVFPQIANFFSGILGIETPLNFILLFFIAIIILKQFLMTIKISELTEKKQNAGAAIAFDEFENRRNRMTDLSHSFAVCAYRESPHLRACLESLKTRRQNLRSLLRPPRRTNTSRA